MLALSIFATILILVAWTAVYFLPIIPWWVALVITLFFVLLIGGIVLFRLIRAKLRAAALERELLRQAADQA